MFATSTMSFVYIGMYDCNLAVIFRFCGKDSIHFLNGGSGTESLFNVNCGDWDRDT